MAGRPRQRPATGSRGRTTRPGGWRNLIVGLVFIAIGVSVFFIAQGPATGRR